MPKTSFSLLFICLFFVFLRGSLNTSVSTQTPFIAKGIIALQPSERDTLSPLVKQSTAMPYSTPKPKMSKVGACLGIVLLILLLRLRIPILFLTLVIGGSIMLATQHNRSENTRQPQQETTIMLSSIDKEEKADTLTSHELAYQKLKKDQATIPNAQQRAVNRKQMQLKKEAIELKKIQKKGIDDYILENFLLALVYAFLGLGGLLFCGLFIYSFFSQGPSLLPKAGLCLLLGIFFFVKMAQALKHIRRLSKSNIS